MWHVVGDFALGVYDFVNPSPTKKSMELRRLAATDHIVFNTCNTKYTLHAAIIGTVFTWLKWKFIVFLFSMILHIFALRWKKHNSCGSWQNIQVWDIPFAIRLFVARSKFWFVGAWKCMSRLRFPDVCSKGPIDNISALVQITAWHQSSLWLLIYCLLPHTYASLGPNESIWTATCQNWSSDHVFIDKSSFNWVNQVRDLHSWAALKCANCGLTSPSSFHKRAAWVTQGLEYDLVKGSQQCLLKYNHILQLNNLITQTVLFNIVRVCNDGCIL